MSDLDRSFVLHYTSPGSSTIQTKSHTAVNKHTYRIELQVPHSPRGALIVTERFQYPGCTHERRWDHPYEFVNPSIQATSAWFEEQSNGNWVLGSKTDAEGRAVVLEWTPGGVRDARLDSEGSTWTETIESLSGSIVSTVSQTWRSIF